MLNYLMAPCHMLPPRKGSPIRIAEKVLPVVWQGATFDESKNIAQIFLPKKIDKKNHCARL